MATHLEVTAEARRKGKVRFSTWHRAKSEGIDPDSLAAQEQAEAEQFDAEFKEYERYVYAEPKQPKPDNADA